MQSLRSSPSPAPITTTCPIPHPALPYSSPDASHLFAPLARDPSLAPLYPKLFFLHGVWSRFFPAMSELRRVIDSGEIGEVVSAHASFCQNDGAGACSATLETGIYCAQFIQWAMGGVAPESVEGVNFRLHEVR
mmetsp:Transcript_68573/g.190948  ORF Transcript_68573/g.190948 Transcript_68573/m.190948 type:complete len:134 (+) Transcript_68573:4860-5261(+)